MVAKTRCCRFVNINFKSVDGNRGYLCQLKVIELTWAGISINSILIGELHGFLIICKQIGYA